MEDNSRKVVCPLCSQRSAKRFCPALATRICPVCCGTKRLVEIACPEGCVYLATSRSHPPAAVVRQQEADRALLLPMVQQLTEKQAGLFLTVGAVISRHQGEALHRLLDADVAQAAESLAVTLETAGRGIVYEHQPQSLPAARLLVELKALVTEVTAKERSAAGGSVVERDAAITMRSLEAAARASAARDPRSVALLELLARMLTLRAGSDSGARMGEKEPPEGRPHSLIIP